MKIGDAGSYKELKTQRTTGNIEAFNIKPPEKREEKSKSIDKNKANWPDVWVGRFL